MDVTNGLVAEKNHVTAGQRRITNYRLGHDLAFETQRNLARRQEPFVDLAVNPL